MAPAALMLAVCVDMSSLLLDARIHCNQSTLLVRLCNVSGPGSVASWHRSVLRPVSTAGVATRRAGSAESAVQDFLLSPRERRSSFRGIGTWTPALCS